MKFHQAHDEEIDRALGVIGQASPREGMEARVLRGIEARRLAAGREQGIGSGGWAFRFAGLAVALAVLGVVLFSGHGREASVPVRGVSVPHEAVPVTQERVSPTIAARGAVVRVSVKRVRGGHPGGQVERLSFPAPEAPLTEQERLLAALAASPQPQAIEALDPVRRAASVAETERAFAAFLGERNTGGYE